MGGNQEIYLPIALWIISVIHVYHHRHITTGHRIELGGINSQFDVVWTRVFNI